MSGRPLISRTAMPGLGLSAGITLFMLTLVVFLPIGALLASPKYSDVFVPGSHGSTFGGNPLACAASLAVIKVIEEEGLLAHAAEFGKLFMEGLQQFVENYEPTSAYGTKALGEPPACPGAPAIRNAVLQATGVAVNRIPLTPHVLFERFREEGLL